MPTPERLHSPSAQRNQGPIAAVLQRVLPAQGTLLEIASGSGQHAAHCAATLPGWQWQPSDADVAALPSISAWCQGLANVRPPLHLDVMAPHWPGAPQPADALLCVNMLHIAPWPCCAALMQGAARHLAPTAVLLLYGPFLVDGEATAPGNLAFDADLRQRHPAWGLRWLHDVLAEAAKVGLHLHERVAMPANNLMLVLGRGH